MSTRAMVWCCTLSLMWCGCKEDRGDDSERILQDLRAVAAASPGEPLVVSFGQGEGGVSKQAMTQLWANHPEWTREQVLDAAIRQELIWQSWEGESLEPAPWQSLRFAKRRGLVNAWIQQELLAKETTQIDEAALMSMVNQQAMARVRPPGYVASHLLVRVPKDADEARSEAARQALIELEGRLDTSGDTTAGELLAVLATLDEEQFKGFDVLVNAQMMFPLQGIPAEVMPEGWINVVPEFLGGAKQVVAQRGFDKLSKPVKTSFGWHVIVVHERMPMIEPDRAEVEAILRYSWRTGMLQQELLSRIEPLYTEYTWSSDPGALEDDLTSGGPGASQDEE